MRTTELARIAAQAEILLLKRQAGTIVRRAIYGAVAAIFAIALFAVLHVAAIVALQRYAGIGELGAIAIVLAVDLAVAGLFALLASRTPIDVTAVQAREVRDQSLAQLRDSLTLSAMLRPATGLLARKSLNATLLRKLGSKLSKSRR